MEDLKARALVKDSCTSSDLQDKTARRSVEDLKAQALAKNRKTLKTCDCRQGKGADIFVKILKLFTKITSSSFGW